MLAGITLSGRSGHVAVSESVSSHTHLLLAADHDSLLSAGSLFSSISIWVDQSSSSSPILVDDVIVSSLFTGIPEGGALESVSVFPGAGPACDPYVGGASTLTGGSCDLGGQGSGPVPLGRDMDIVLDPICDFPRFGEVSVEFSGGIPTLFCSASCARKRGQEHHPRKLLPIDAGFFGMGDDARACGLRPPSGSSTSRADAWWCISP